MARVEPHTLPDDAFLQTYRASGAYTDCFAIDVPHAIAFERYVAAFYTTWVFKTERLILKLVDRPSTDAGAKRLADGAVDSFAAWDVEARGNDQMLLTDNVGRRTRSWLMARSLTSGSTRLFFGSAVVPAGRDKSGKPRLGLQFSALLGFHKLYSRILLAAAARKLAR